MPESNLTRYFEANKSSWNKRTAVHTKSAFYNVEAFKQGQTSLNATELLEVGDVHGKSLLHLQCHFGMDTLSWARQGAIVTGVDFSEAAIDYARALSNELEITAEFICCNVYDLPTHLTRQYDIVFTSYGVISWLPDLQRWASVIHKALKPGGMFYMAEFHPVVWMMDENFECIKYHYHNKEVIAETTTGTYADKDADITSQEFGWNHSLGEVINALIGHNLRLDYLHEYDFSYYNCFNNLVQQPDGRYTVKGIENKMPMMYSLKATKPGL